MAGLFNRFLDYIGIEEADMEDEHYTSDFYSEDIHQSDNVVSFDERVNAKRQRGASSSAAPASLSAAMQMKMIVYHPVSYEDTQNIIDNMKSRKPVIVNMEELEIECAQRILDFMAGAVYALNGTIFKIARGIFVVAPNNYDVIGNGDSGLDNDGLI